MQMALADRDDTDTSPAAAAATAGRDDLGAELLAVVARLHRWATRRADLPVSPARGRLLALVDELAPSRIGDLARADHCSQPTMTTQLQRLAELGLVSRVADPSDARAVLIDITPAGRDLLARLREARAETVRPLLAGLSSADRTRLRTAVGVLAGVLDRDAAPG